MDAITNISSAIQEATFKSDPICKTSMYTFFLAEAAAGITVLVVSILAVTGSVSGATLGWTIMGSFAPAALVIPSVLSLPETKTKEKLIVLIASVALIAIGCAITSILPVLGITGVLSAQVLGWITLGLYGGSLGFLLLTGSCVGGCLCCCPDAIST